MFLELVKNAGETRSGLGGSSSSTRPLHGVLFNLAPSSPTRGEGIKPRELPRRAESLPKFMVR